MVQIGNSVMKNICLIVFWMFALESSSLSRVKILDADPSIRLELIPTQKMLVGNEFEHLSAFDPGWEKWLISFSEIIGKPPFSYQIKRLGHPDPNVFLPYKQGMDTEQIFIAKLFKQPVDTVVSARG